MTTPTQTPTPRTDAAWLKDHFNYHNLLDFTRQLERELEEAKENTAPHMCKDGHEKIFHSSDDELCPVCKAIAERDELRTKLRAAEAVCAEMRGLLAYSPENVTLLKRKNSELEKQLAEPRKDSERLKADLVEVLDGLGALSNPSELCGWAISEERAKAIVDNAKGDK